MRPTRERSESTFFAPLWRAWRGSPRLTAFGLALLTAAAVTGCSTVFPRQKWSKRWGTMVPHHTFPGDCQLCHVPDNWEEIKEDFSFDHTAETGYELVGAHAEAACLRCHNDRGPVTAYLDRGCGGCHGDPHNSRLGMNCEKCHNEQWWEPDGMIAEHALTAFPLVGPHALAPCESCHLRASVGDYKGAPTECHLCHQEEARFARPNHVVNSWITRCEECHDLTDWNAVDFRHDLFALEGGHAGLDCEQCHVGGRIAGTPNTCYACHSQDYVGAANHVASSFSIMCLDCHDTEDWNIP